MISRLEVYNCGVKRAAAHFMSFDAMSTRYRAQSQRAAKGAIKVVWRL